MPSGIRRMPIEMVTRVLAQLELHYLICASQVCQTWRFLAFDDPLYWRHIVISDISSQTLNRAEHRLLCGRDRTRIYFELDFWKQDRKVETHLLPMLAAALPRARILVVILKSFYRLQAEKVLSAEAKHLERFYLYYGSDPEPDLFLDITLSCGLFDGQPRKLKHVRLQNIILPRKPIGAFLGVEEVWWLHERTTYQDEFPCYLFDFFPNTRRLRLSGGQVWFRNAPLPPHVVAIFSKLTWLDLEFQEDTLVAFFRHLPLDGIPELVLASAEFDSVYTALEPLRSYFDLALIKTSSSEFRLTIKGQSHLLRHFTESHRYYKAHDPESELVNCLFADAAFFAQLGSLRIPTSLWGLLNPWIPELTHLPKLIVEIDYEYPGLAPLPREALPCRSLSILVIQAKHHLARIDVEDLLAFAGRITKDRVALQLRRVFLQGPRERIDARFESVHYSTERYLITPLP
ncbi:hypothetical protein AURDEDRAFT_167705 [Auricularia subglabra TFB-10046 SS5]|nr:hypothetical protein AURDEDRAFT_167705 [Auricularia subglabra TFB-10046 SS5]